MGTRRRCLVLILAAAATGLTSLASGLGCASARSVEWHVPAEPVPHGEGEPAAVKEGPAPKPAWPGSRSSPESALAHLARTVDGLEWEIVREGTIGIKAPDIWGQDRMTKSRAEYEQQLAGQQKDGFKSVMSAVIRRYEAVTSQIELDAVAPAPGPAKNSTATATATSATAKATAATPSPPRDATEKEPIGVESTVVLDERSHFLNHLNQLRRINAGDELTDRPGYGLYLIRMPITLAPGRDNGRGRGAIVTVEARPYVTRSLLPDTVRRVVLEGTKDQLRPIVLAGLRGTASASGGGAVPILLPSEVETLFGREDLKAVSEAARLHLGPDLEREPHRAEVRVAEWLDRELAAVYPLTPGGPPPIAAKGQRGDAAAPGWGELVARRQFRELARFREPDSTDSRVVRAGAEEIRIGDAMRPPVDMAARVERMLVFALRVQAAAVDRMIKEDIRAVAQDAARNHLSAELVARLGEMSFTAIDPPEEARRIFNEYVAAKWRIRVFAIEPVVEQQNVADFLSRRSLKHVDVAGAAGPGAGVGAAGAAIAGGSQSEVDAAAVRLNPTMVGFGAGESTFGWRFYPRVRVPSQDDLIRRAERRLFGDDPSGAEHQIEPGQRECVAFVVMPSFVPAIEFSIFSGWFHHSAVRLGRPTDMESSLALCKKLETAKGDLAAAKRRLLAEGNGAASRLRCSEVEILEDRLRQLEDLLPTQHYVSALPYGSEPVAAEIFESRGGHLAPVLTAWHGQPPDGTGDASIMIEGRGFSVHDTRVLVGNTPAEAVPISRTVLQVRIDAHAQAMTAPDGRSYYDVHAATPNGVSNHLLIETKRPGPPSRREPEGWWEMVCPDRREPKAESR